MLAVYSFQSPHSQSATLVSVRSSDVHTSVPNKSRAEEHFVKLGADVQLECGHQHTRDTEGDQEGDTEGDTEREAVVVWSWRAARAPDTSADRVLSVGKMLVRTDGKGEVN